MEFSIEKAQALLGFVKEVSNEDSTLLDNVTVVLDEEDHPSFGYQPGEKTIYICIEKLEDPQDIQIIDYVNKEFGLGLKNTDLVRHIHGFLHELGHHIDIGHKSEKELRDYMESYMAYDWEIKIRTMHNTQEMCDLVDSMEYAIELIKEDDITFGKFYGAMDEMMEEYTRLRKERDEIDLAYRRNPMEYAADKFAAKIMDKYLRRTMPELFEPQEHVIRKLEK